MTAIITRRGSTRGADMFAGWGGSSQGIHAAGVDIEWAANHDPLSVECHNTNWQQVRHFLADLSDRESPQFVDPITLPAVDFLWASPSCFPAGTLVLTRRGLVPIEDVVVGDEAWTHMQRWRPVTDTMRRVAATVVVYPARGHPLEVTPSHGFWARRADEEVGGRIAAADLTGAWVARGCDSIGTPATDAYEWVQVRKVTTGRVDVDVFNITVDEDHTYVADGIVVHNCKDHSQANAEKLYEKGPQAQLAFDDEEDFDDVRYANSERSRVSMCCPLRYARRHRPEIVVVENVPLAAKWGPGRNGTTFRWWLNEWTRLGYEYRVLFLNSMFFPPCPQSRDRLYVVLWKKGNKAPDLDYRPTAYCTSDRCGGRIVEAVQTWKQRTPAWPLPQWGGYGAQYVYTCPDCRARVHPASFPAYTAIDWSRLGTMIGERSMRGLPPLAPNTLARIRRGLTKFRHGPPIVLPAKGTWGTVRTVVDPLTAQTTQQEKALAFLIKNNGGADETDYGAVPLHGPLGALTTSPAQSLVTALFNGQNNDSAQHAGDALFTVRAGGGANSLATAILNGQSNDSARHAGDALFTVPAGGPATCIASFPFLVEMRGGGSHRSGQHRVDLPLHAVTAGGLHHGLTTPAVFAKFNGGPADTAWHGVHDPLGTLTTRFNGGTGLAVLPWVDQYMSDPIGVTEQLATCMTHLRQALASIEVDLLCDLTDEELETVRFRMLEPDPELRRAMAFADDYILIGNKSEMTSGLGNAVTPPVATWITTRCLETLSGGGLDRAA